MKRQKIRNIIQIISFLLFPIIFYYISPFLSLFGAAKGLIAGSIIIFIFLFLLSLFLGRAFCGYVCPMGSFQDICTVVQNKKIDPRTYWIKYLIFVPWILLLLTMPLITSPGFHGVRFFYQTDNHIPFGFSLTDTSSYVVYYSVLAIIFLMSVKFGRRSFCYHLCWVAPFMIAGRFIRNKINWSSLHLEAVRDRCTDCKTCSDVCPKSLDVHAHVKRGDLEDLECILCGSCVDNCPQKLIYYRFIDNRFAEKIKTLRNKRNTR
jgi:ferredoxin-type protein NapH